MGEFFANNGQLIVFLHVLSAIIWVGGMIAMRVAVHPVIARGGVTDAQMLLSDKIADILEPKQRLGITMQTVGRLFNLVMPFIVILFATGLIMAVAMGGTPWCFKRAVYYKRDTMDDNGNKLWLHVLQTCYRMENV